jgi:hypothetical protein
MVESSFLDEDPVLFESASYWECRRRAREIQARWYADILDRARRLRDDPLFDAMQALLAARREVGGRISSSAGPSRPGSARWKARC